MFRHQAAQVWCDRAASAVGVYGPGANVGTDVPCSAVPTGGRRRAPHALPVAQHRHR